MAKHSQAFVEVVTRFYVPLGHDLKDIENIDLTDILKQAGTVEVHQPDKSRKGGKRGSQK